jgi:processive 1,2-diacylglycerol beta-glucosyltransferase
LNKNVLILSEAVGVGHTKAAEALMQGIELLDPSIEVQVLELGRELHPVSAGLLYRCYLNMVTRYPGVWRKVYDYKQNEPFSLWKQSFIYRMFHRTMKDMLNLISPDLIICTHPFSSSSVTYLKRAGYTLRLCTMITDFHAHGAWVQPEVDHYLVSGEEVYTQLMKMGVPKEKVSITGIPLTMNFRIKHNKQEMRQLLGIKDMPTMLVMGGGLGLGGMERLANILAKWRDSLQIVICTGHNERLRRVLEAELHHPNVHILGFVNNIDRWMDASDWLITKAGGITCFEALAKRLPLFIYQPLPGHEEHNCEFLIRHKLAIRIDTEEEIADWVDKLLCYPQAISFLEQNMQQFQQMLDPLAAARAVLAPLRAADEKRSGKYPPVFISKKPATY